MMRRVGMMQCNVRQPELRRKTADELHQLVTLPDSRTLGLMGVRLARDVRVRVDGWYASALRRQAANSML